MKSIDERTRTTIFRSALRGIGYESLAESFELSVGEVEEIVKAEKAKRPSFLDLDPRQILDDHYFYLLAALEDLASVAAKEKGGTRVRAIEARIQIFNQILELSQAAGRVPATTTEMWRYTNTIGLGNKMLDLLADEGLLTVELLDKIGASFSTGQHQRELIEDGLSDEQA